MVTEIIYGDMVLSASATDLISRVLLSHGEWGYVETQLLSHIINPETVAYDAGAYIGTFSLGISAYAPNKIVAIEANRESCDRLRINLNSNCQVPHAIENVAVGSRSGKAVPLGYNSENLGSIAFREYDRESR
ncbi:MAG: FkbM family methyltransferase [Candidatus Thiodiazotropha sp. (ex Gloverina cf. vestifex)]|nr:FkbM family methyltransferase [Candidatus Thiodiazotropha sp. (ex Gloverina cf. vestifex)]